MKRIFLIIIFLLVPFSVHAQQGEFIWGDDIPYAYLLAMGFIEDTTSLRIVGFNPDIDATGEAVWDINDIPTTGAGPLRCFGLGQTPVNLYVSSDDAADAGKLIYIEHLDGSYDETITVMALGAAAASSGTVFTQIGSGTILRVNRATAVNDGYVGNIYIHKDTVDGGDDGIPDAPATDIIAGIVTDNNLTFQACYSVPNGYKMLIRSVCITNNDIGAAPATVEIRSFVSSPGSAVYASARVAIASGADNCRYLDPPILAAEKADYEFSARALNAGGDQSITIDFGIIIRPFP